MHPHAPQDANHSPDLPSGAMNPDREFLTRRINPAPPMLPKRIPHAAINPAPEVLLPLPAGTTVLVAEPLIYQQLTAEYAARRAAAAQLAPAAA